MNKRTRAVFTMQRYDKEQEQVKLQGKGQMEAGDKRQGE